MSRMISMSGRLAALLVVAVVVVVVRGAAQEQAKKVSLFTKFNDSKVWTTKALTSAWKVDQTRHDVAKKVFEIEVSQKTGFIFTFPSKVKLYDDREALLDKHGTLTWTELKRAENGMPRYRLVLEYAEIEPIIEKAHFAEIE